MCERKQQLIQTLNPREQQQQQQQREQREQREQHSMKKKRFLTRFKFSFEKCFENDFLLEKLCKKVKNGEKLWKQFIDSEEEEDGEEDAVQDGEQVERDVVSREKSRENNRNETKEEETEVKDEREDEEEGEEDAIGEDVRIRKLLKSQWEERVRQLEKNNCPPEAPKVMSREMNKSILRKARLHINKRTLLRIRRAQRLEPMEPIARQQTLNSQPIRSKESSKSGQPGFITCAICCATKYYSHVQRRYGVFSCEPCSKFFARFMKEPKQYLCSNSGDCPITESQSLVKCCQRSRAVLPSRSRATDRCRACWLKVCLQKFSICPKLRQMISHSYSPKLMTPPNVALITVDTSSGLQSKVQCMASAQSQSQQSLLMVASDQMRLNTSRSSRKSGPRVKRVCRSAGIVSGLPRATFGGHQSDEDSDQLPVDVYLCRAFEDEDVKKKKSKIYRCKECAGCRAQDCGHCNHCLDKKKFGGQNVIKQACRYRTCTKLRPHMDCSTIGCE